MADGLPSLDGVGYPEKMTRVSGTYNPKRGRWAVTIPAHDFAQNPFDYRIPAQPLPEYDDIDPFKGIITESECFDLVKWAHENPIAVRKKTYESNITTVSVGANTGECALPTCLDRAIRVSKPSASCPCCISAGDAQTIGVLRKALPTIRRRKL